MTEETNNPRSRKAKVTRQVLRLLVNSDFLRKPLDEDSAAAAQRVWNSFLRSLGDDNARELLEATVDETH